MVRFLLVLALAAAVTIRGSESIPGVPVAPAAVAAVRAERWRLLFEAGAVGVRRSLGDLRLDAGRV